MLSKKDFGSFLIIVFFPQALHYVLSVCLSKEVSWLKYISEGEILTSLLVIIGFLFTEIILLGIIPGKWTSIFPFYKLNGFQSFLVSIVFTLFNWKYLPWIYQHFNDLILTVEWLALIFCFLVYLKAKLWSTIESYREDTGEYIYNFYSGIERHPSIGKFQLKQIFNCRFGMMSWPLISICCLAYQYDKYGYISNSLRVSTILQLIYVGKFFWWEQGYFNTMDMAYDHCGFYILWGVMCWVPGFYTLSSIYLADRLIDLSSFQAIGYLSLGLFSIYVNYEVDYQKILARTNPESQIWGKSIKTLKMDYLEHGQITNTVFCLSGWWGVSRHFHYIPELLACLSWALPCGFNLNRISEFETWLPYAYFIYLSILLFHRIYRDEEKCERKYGNRYNEYKKYVPYRLIPYFF